MEYSRRQEAILSNITQEDIKAYNHREVYADESLSIYIFETDDYDIIEGCVFYDPLIGKYQMYINEHADYYSTVAHEMVHIANGDV